MIAEWADWMHLQSAGQLAYGLIPPLAWALLRALFKRKRPSHAIAAKLTTTTVIDDLSELPQLEVRYAGMPVEDLKVTNALIWNNGKDPIRRDNVATSDPLRILLPDESKIWDARVLYQTRDANTAQVAAEDRSVRAEFDFLNPYDAMLINILHTGPLDDATLAGTLIGSTTDVQSAWQHMLGVHGPRLAGQDRIVNMNLLGTIGSVVNILFVSILVLAFVFSVWWPVLAFAAGLFALSVYTLWPSNDIPRKVRTDLQDFIKRQDDDSEDD